MNGNIDGATDLEELARWFLLSVCQHLVGEDWQSPADCPIAPEELAELTQRYLQDRSARQSLLMVLKDSRYRYTLIRFGPSRDHSRLQLSDSTIAYRHARTLLQALLQEPSLTATDHALRRPATVNARRAARRAQAATGGGRSRRDQSPDPGPADVGMSDEEYARLEQALATAAPADSDAVPHRYASNEDRLSLLSGLLAGTLLFLLVFWLFL